MEKPCEFCGESRPVIYCRVDAAHLCLSCDARVHSANALSERHYRVILCEGCGNHPASVRCLDHWMFMCDGCDKNLHEASAQHQKQVVSGYIGCPSAEDFALLWGYYLNELQARGSQAQDVSTSSGSLVPSVANIDFSSEFCPWIDGSSLTSEVNSMASIFGAAAEMGSSNLQTKIYDKNQLQQDRSFIMQQILDLERFQLTESNKRSSSSHRQVQTNIYSTRNINAGQLGEDIPHPCQNPQGPSIDLQQMEKFHHELVQPFPLPFSQLDHLNSSSSAKVPLHGDVFWQCRSPAQTSQLWSQNMQDLGICEEIDSNDGFNISNVDLTFRNYEELIGGDQDLTRSLFDGKDVNCSSVKKDVSFEKSDDGCRREIQDISLAPTVYITPSSVEERNIVPSDQAHRFVRIMDSPQSIHPSYSTLSFSLSRLSDESSAADNLDSGLSPNIIEPPWISPDMDNAHSEARENAMIRYKEKKKVRMYQKQIQYASRKARSDMQKQVKGQLVKAEGYESALWM